MITEKFQGYGRFDLRLHPNTPARIVEQIVEFGHIVVTDTPVDPTALGDAAMLAAARYTGVVYRPTRRLDLSVDITGHGLLIHLGDQDGKGDILETAWTASTQTFVGWITELLGTIGGVPSPLQAGTVTAVSAPASGELGRSFRYVNRRQILDYVVDYYNAAYKVRPDGRVDAGPESSLFATTPRAVLFDRAGSDPNVDGLPATVLDVDWDAQDWTSRVILFGEGQQEETVLVGTADNATNPYKDLFGNALVRKRPISSPITETSEAGQIAQVQLNRFANVSGVVTAATDHPDVHNLVTPGDQIWAWFPEGRLQDPFQQTTHRGEVLSPVRLRVWEVRWPVRDGMGVYYRTVDGQYLDLTPYVRWETGQARLKVGAPSRRIVSRESPAIPERVFLQPVQTANLADGAVTDPKVTDVVWDKITGGTNTADLVIGGGGTIKSANFAAGSAGWIIAGDGSAEFNNIVVRGDIVSANWDGGFDLSAGRDGTATQGFFLDSSAGASQWEGDVFVGGQVEVVDSLGNATRLKGTGLIEVEPYTSAQWSGPGSFRFAEEPNGNPQENSIAYAFQMAGGYPAGSTDHPSGWRALGGSVGDGSLLGAPALILEGSRVFLRGDVGGDAFLGYTEESSGGFSVTNTGLVFKGSSIDVQVSGAKLWSAISGSLRAYTGLWLVSGSATDPGPRYLSWWLSDQSTRTGWFGFGSAGSDTWSWVNERPAAASQITVYNGTTGVARLSIDGDGATIWRDSAANEVMRLDSTYQVRVMREGRRTEVLLPAGTLLPFAANSTAKIPTGYLEANGQAVSRTAYADLFAAISTLWGAGDGSTTFNVPDLRGRFVIGYGGASGLTAGAVGGAWNHTHSFSDSFTTSGPSGTTFVPATPDDVTVALSHTHTGSVSGTTGAANPPYAAVIWMIKV